MCHTCKREYDPCQFKLKKNGAYTVTCLSCLEKARRYRSNRQINIIPEPVVQEPVVQTPKLTYYDIMGDDNIKNIILDYARGDNNHWRNVFKESINEINNINNNVNMDNIETDNIYYDDLYFSGLNHNQRMVRINYLNRINNNKMKKK